MFSFLYYFTTQVVRIFNALILVCIYLQIFFSFQLCACGEGDTLNSFFSSSGMKVVFQALVSFSSFHSVS